MTTISVPEPEAVDLLGDLPDGVEVIVWDGLRRSGDRPAEADSIEFFVGRYDAKPPPKQLLESLPALRVVQLVSAGYEIWSPVLPDGVTLCNGRGIHGASTAELAVAGMLASLRGLPAFHDQQRAHEWRRAECDGLDGRRVLVVGAGDIGARIAAAARVFDAEVTLVGRTARDGVRSMDELADLVPEHDVIALAVPLTDDTHHLVDATLLAAVPDGGLVVNIARGPVVDTDALVAELSSGRLRAFLDVTDPEPLPVGHPLWDAPNLVLTPHVGGGTSGWQARAYRLVAEQVRRYVAGEELQNRIDEP